MSSPRIFAVVLNFDALSATKKAVESVENSKPHPPKIIIVDNPKTESQARILKEMFPQHQVIASPANLGYAGGNNLGLRSALEQGAEYLWVLSNDTEVTESTLDEMLKVAQMNSNVPIGLVGSLTVYDHSDHLYFFKGLIDKRGRTRNALERTPLGQIQELKTSLFGETDFVNGASILVGRSALEKVGLIPEDYFLYFEDPEWSLMFTRAGYRNLVAYKAKVYHLKGQQLQRNYVAEFYCRRNEYFFRLRNGFSVSRGHYLLRLATRYAKHLSKWIVGRERADNRNMMHVLALAMRSVWQGKMGHEQLRLPHGAPRAKEQ